MNSTKSGQDVFTAKQRLTASRLSLTSHLADPLWVSVARWCIRRGLLHLEMELKRNQIR